MDVLGQKGVEGVKARLVQQIEGVEGEVLFPAGGLKAHPALVGLAGDTRAPPQKQQPAAAQLDQLGRGQLPAAEVVGGDAGHPGFEVPVDADKGQVGVDVEVGVVGQGDDAVHLVLAHQVDAALLGLAVVARDGDDGAVAPLHQAADDGVGQGGEEGMPQGGPDQGGGVGLVGLEAAGVTVHPVAQLVGGVQDADAVFLPHGDVVEHLGYGAQGHPGLGGHVLHGGGGGRFSGHGMLLLCS